MTFSTEHRPVGGWDCNDSAIVCQMASPFATR